MRELGYGPDKHLKIKVSTRNDASYRDLAVILIDARRVHRSTETRVGVNHTAGGDVQTAIRNYVGAK